MKFGRMKKKKEIEKEKDKKVNENKKEVMRIIKQNQVLKINYFYGFEFY